MRPAGKGAPTMSVALMSAALSIVGPLLVSAPLSPRPIGSWGCAIAGSPAGNLVVDRTSYSFTAAGEDGASPGKLASFRARLGARTDASMIKVTTGPLVDDLGIRLGFYNAAANPAVLVFNMGPGKGLLCSPV